MRLSVPMSAVVPMIRQSMLPARMAMIPARAEIEYAPIIVNKVTFLVMERFVLGFVVSACVILYILSELGGRCCFYLVNTVVIATAACTKLPIMAKPKSASRICWRVILEFLYQIFPPVTGFFGLFSFMLEPKVGRRQKLLSPPNCLRKVKGFVEQIPCVFYSFIQ